MAEPSADTWEQERLRLHHDVFHHHFYHFLGAPPGSESDSANMAALTERQLDHRRSLPSGLQTAVSNWPAIDAAHVALFQRAPAEAITTPEARLAKAALATAEKSDWPDDVRATVYSRAGAILEQERADAQSKIKAALVKPSALLNMLDKFIFALASPKPEISPYEARQLASEFLANCRELDRELSNLGRFLKSSTSGKK